MSVDLKIQNVCDHKINWEVGKLESDRRSVLFSKPIASLASLLVRVNNVVVDSSSYVVRVREDVASANKPFYVVFVRKIKDYQPLIEAQYVTLSTFCRKCLGIGYTDDFEYINDKDIRTISDEGLLLQNVEKYVVTKMESNPFHSWVGTGLHQLIGTKITDVETLRSSMQDQVSSAIQKFKTVQRQVQASGRKMTPGELFGNLISMNVKQAEDPSIFTITVNFTSQNRTMLSYDQTINISAPRRRITFS